MIGRAAAVRRTLRVLFPLLVVACQGIDPTPGDEPVTEADRARFVKRRVQDALAFRLQKRFEAAEHQLRLALSGDPDHARAHALLARTLRDLGREEEAARHAGRAQQLAPPPPPLPEGPLVSDASGVLVLLLPPDIGRGASPALPEASEDPRIPRTLAGRIRTRLPNATVRERAPGSVQEAEEWLRREAARAAIGVRTDQALCTESAKDGPFARASLTVVVARPGALPDEPVRVAAVDDDPALPPACTDAALALALEKALSLPGVVRALAEAPGPRQEAWAGLAARALVPERERVAASEIAHAQAEAKRSVSPPDAGREIERAEQERAAEQALDTARAALPRDPETAALEAEVAGERRRRDELLAALRVDELRQRPPLPEEIAVLRVAETREPESVGLRLARQRARGAEVEARVLYAPDGAVMARFYFERGAGALLLREEDSDDDGIADRWTAYARERPSEVWEDRGASGATNAHIFLAADGVSTERIEIDMDADGRAERIFHYAAGSLLGGDADTDGDGRLDRFERYEPGGGLATRDEDLDGDGRIDVHSELRAGRLLRREIRNPAFLESSPTRPLAAP